MAKKVQKFGQEACEGIFAETLHVIGQKAMPPDQRARTVRSRHCVVFLGKTLYSRSASFAAIFLGGEGGGFNPAMNYDHGE